MTEPIESFSLRPGDKLNITNRTPPAKRVTIRIEHGTTITVELHPGAAIKTTVGREKIDVMYDAIGEAGLRIVKD